MKRKTVFITVSVLLIVAFGALSFICSNNDKKDKILLNALTKNLSNYHFAPQKIDDKFSERVFTLYLQNLDFGKRFFTQEDSLLMVQYRLLIDDQVNQGTFEFFNLSLELMQKRVKQTRRFFTEILSKPFDFEKDEYIETDPDKRKFAKDSVELKEYWAKYLKFETLSRLTTAIQLQEDAKTRKDTAFVEKDFPTLEKQSREKVLKTYTDYFHRIDRTDLDDRFSIFLNSITSTYDPHTNFFPPNDKESFDITLSGKLEGIGATLQETGSYIKVAKLVPGSPSWKQGELQVNDIILKVAQGNAEPVDIVDMKIDEAVKLIRGKKGTEVRLTIKKPDGSIKTISIIRDVIQIEETFAKSTIVTDKKGKLRIGYIYLPKFYTDFEDRTGRNCSDDVEKEVAKLKKDKVDGIIIDLRNNGGGSLGDVVQMAGLFIPKGPIVQVKSRDKDPEVLPDYNPAVQYSGPLAIMVNSFSASASEIFAAAMQDYKRAIVIGSATYGKGTVQRFVDLDKDVPLANSEVKPIGALKLTIQKFYRINGDATQKKGVLPDIILPDVYHYLEMGEKDEKYCMDWNSIAKANYQTWLNAPNIEKLKKESNSRLKSDDYFVQIEEEAQLLKKNRDESVYPLNLKKYQEYEKKRKEESKKYDDMDKKSNDLSFGILSDDLTRLNSDTTEMSRFKGWQQDLKKDMYLKEAFSVMKDMK